MRATLLALLFSLVACSKNTAATADKPVADPIPMGQTGQPATPADPAALAMLDAYEKVRAALAADDDKALPAASHELETSVKAATSKATPAVAHHLAEIETHATHLAAAKDLAGARAAFGEVSRHLIALLAADKVLAHGRHVFECPMVKGGYAKWIQPNDNLENPYMGKQMLACGGESSWE